MSVRQSFPHSSPSRQETRSTGSVKRLNGIGQLEIWTDGTGFGHGWYADYVIITDNRTGEEACFLIREYLNKENGGVNDNHLILKKQPGDVSCRERSADNNDDDDEIDTVQTRRMKALKQRSSVGSSVAVPDKRTYLVETKTGSARREIILQINDVDF
jgi:hypothetical protein